MQFFGPEAVAAAMPWPDLIDAIEQVFVTEGAISPDRTVHSVEVTEGPDAVLLLKPAWTIGDVIAVKVVTFFGDNGTRNLPTVNAGVLLFSANDGTLMGACDGNELTARRTAAASAVAAKRLARPRAESLLVIGTGALSSMAVQAHTAVGDFRSVQVWGRNIAKTEQVVSGLQGLSIPVTVSDDLDSSVADADVICSVTGSTEPLIKGSILKEGSHVDLIGAFTPEMRESDDDVIRRADVWVDTRSDAILAGDLAQPLAEGLMSMADVQGDLAELVSGNCPSRTDGKQITMFKSAGTALEDLAAAKLVFGS
jgi:alanine dehydrogenase